MGATREAIPVKLFIGFPVVEQLPLQEKLIAEFGTSDHFMSLIPSDGTLHRVFLSFERLVAMDDLGKIQQQTKSIEAEILAAVTVGFVDNRRVVAVGAGVASPVSPPGESSFGAVILQFRDHGVSYLPGLDPDFQSDSCRDFFLAVRKIYRGQLRSMCLLRR